jgi:hypothetical protein
VIAGADIQRLASADSNALIVVNNGRFALARKRTLELA